MTNKYECVKCGFVNEDEVGENVFVKVYGTREEYEKVIHPATSGFCRCKRCGALYVIDTFSQGIKKPYDTPNHCDPLV